MRVAHLLRSRSFSIGFAVLCLHACLSTRITTITVDAFNVVPPTVPLPTTTVASLTRLSARRGRGGLGGASSKGKKKQDALLWYTIPATTQDLPQKDNDIAVIDTQLQSLKNGQTNPTGAVCVGTLHKQTYAFQVNCPCCQIPLTRAKMVDDTNTNDAAILVCDFCKTSFDLQDNGKQLPESVETANPGLFGSIAKTVFAASNNNKEANLQMYNLGDKNGKLVLGFPNLE